MNPHLCGVVRLTEYEFSMTSRESALCSVWPGVHSGSGERQLAGSFLQSCVNAEIGEGQLLFGQIIMYPEKQTLSRREHM